MSKYHSHNNFCHLLFYLSIIFPPYPHLFLHEFTHTEFIDLHQLIPTEITHVFVFFSLAHEVLGLSLVAEQGPGAGSSCQWWVLRCYRPVAAGCQHCLLLHCRPGRYRNCPWSQWHLQSPGSGLCAPQESTADPGQGFCLLRTRPNQRQSFRQFSVFQVLFS